MRSYTGQPLNATKLSDEMDITEDMKLHHGEDDIKNICLGKTQMLEPDQEVTDLHADEKKISFRKIEKNCTDDTKENNGISETRLSDESPVFGLKKREKQQDQVVSPGDHIMFERNEYDMSYLHHSIVTDLQICSEVKFKRNVEITEVQMANQEEPRKRLSKNDEPCHIMQNHKTCTETSQNYARSLVNGSEKLKISKVEHDIKGRIKYGLIESIKQFLNKVGNFDLMTTTRSGGKLRLTLLLLLMLSTAHSKLVDKMEFSSVYASSNGSISCHEMGKYLCMYSTEIRNMTCNSLKLSTRPHIRVICYDAKQQICCRQTIYNFSSHLFQKNYGTELHNPAMQMFLAFRRNIKHFIVGRTIERSSKKKQKNPFKIDDCYLLFSKLMKKETFINFSELKDASPYFSSTKKSSRHKKKRYVLQSVTNSFVSV